MLSAGLTPVFHPWKLHLAPKDPYPGQRQDPQPPILVTDGDADGLGVQEEWDVAEVVDCRETKRYGIQYKARFTGDWDEWNANPPWQPWTDFEHAATKVLDFHASHPNKPKPPGFFNSTTAAATGQG